MDAIVQVDAEPIATPEFEAKFLKGPAINKESVKAFQIELGRRLRKARKASNKTLQDAANVAGVSTSTTSRMEDGSATPNVPQLYALAKLYRCQFSELALGYKSELMDISQLWPDTQNIVRRHVEYLQVSQQMIQENWSETIGRIKSGNRDVEPPWNL